MPVFCPRPNISRVLRNALDPELFRQRIKENIAGLIDGLGEIDRRRVPPFTQQPKRRP